MYRATDSPPSTLSRRKHSAPLFRIRRKSVTGVSASEGKARATGTVAPGRARARRSRLSRARGSVTRARPPAGAA